MSRPESLTTEELRAVCLAIRAFRTEADIPAVLLPALDRAEDKLLERLALRRAHARSGTAPDPARTR